MVNNKKAYSKILLLIILLIAIIGTQSMAATVSRVTGVKSEVVNNTTVNVSWNKLTNATAYEIYLKAPGKSYESIGKTNRTNATINNLSTNATYYVKVRAVRVENGKTTYGNFSSELKITTNNNVATTLGQVTGLRQSSVTETTATVAWNKVTNATKYEIYVKEQNGSYVNKGTTTNLNTTLNGLTAGKTYYVKVRAVRIENGKTIYGDFSSELKVVTNNSATTTVGTVTNLRQNGIKETTANIMWDKVANVSGYEIYVKEQNGSYKNIGNTIGTNVTINGLKEGSAYYVKVRAFLMGNGATKYGDFSNEITFITGKATPSVTLDKVLNLKATPSASETGLMWNTVSNAEGYEVYVNIPGRGYISIGKTKYNNVRIIGLEAGKTYYIKVRAYNGTTYGDFSDEVKCTMQNEETIGTVTNLTSTVTGTETKLQWNKVENAVKYEVFINIPGRGYISLGKVSTNNVRVVNLSKGVTYQIKVRAVGTINGNVAYGDYSNEVTVIAK